MAMRGENWRFWVPVALIASFAAYTSQKLIRTHLSTVPEPRYDKEEVVPSIRGAIYDRTRDPGTGRPYPLVRSTPCWEYRLDPVAMTGAVVRASRKEKPRTRAAMARTIAQALGMDYGKVLDMTGNFARRYQFLKISSNLRAHDILCDRRYVAGVIVNDIAVRRHFEDRRLAHVVAGVEERYNRELRGVPGRLRVKRDGQGNEIVEKRVEVAPPIHGADVYLTIDHHLQYEVETALRDGLAEFGAAAGWCVVLDAKTAEVLALASLPDFDPRKVANATDDQRKNRVTQFNYEPGSVMKVITAACALDTGFARPGTTFSTDRYERDGRGEQRYYRLPGDAGHVWDERMTLRDAIVHSSNIVIGKLAYDLGPKTVFAGMKRFGFGEKTGIELPGEQYGIVPDPNKRMWDKASRSRAGIGQFVAVTAIQLAAAYQAIANDGVRMRPHVVEKVVAHDGSELYRWDSTPAGRAVSATTARTLRDMMLGVAAPGGTARRAAIRGYSVAGKTGTAQKSIPGGRGYYPGQYRATFCGIVPATDPRIVVLVTLDFDRNTKFHQGGNSSGVVFRRIATAALRFLSVMPDRPEELQDAEEEDEYDRIVEERAERYAPADR